MENNPIRLQIKVYADVVQENEVLDGAGIYNDWFNVRIVFY